MEYCLHFKEKHYICRRNNNKITYAYYFFFYFYFSHKVEREFVCVK